MNAITVRQPHAHLIAIAKDPAVDKFIENRTWRHPYRGPIAIHAGKSREEVFGWDAADTRVYGFSLEQMTFSAIVAVAVLVAIVPVGELPAGMRHNPHGEGPWCWVLQDITPLETPVPYTGARGLFDIPDSILPVSRPSGEPT